MTMETQILINDTDDSSSEYLQQGKNREHEQRIARARALLESRQAQAAPVAASPDPLDASGGYGLENAVAAGSDPDPLKIVREKEFGPGEAGNVGAARAIAEIPRSIGYGIISGINELSETVHDSAGFSRDDLPADFPEDLGKILTNTVQLPNLSEPDSALGSGISSISQFLTGFAAGGAVLKPVKAAGTVGQFAKAATQGAISDFAFFDAQEERLSNMIQEVPALRNPVTEYLAADGDDSQLEGRFKNAIEGLGLGAATEGVAKALGAGIKALKKARAARIVSENGPDAADVLFQSMGEAEAAEPKTLSALGDIDDAVISEVEPVPTEIPQPKLPADEARVANPEIDTLEAAGFRVDREVFEAPAAMDGKRRFGVTRRALDEEGTFGDRWTKIETKAEEWPEAPQNAKSLRGKAAHIWREYAKPIYDKIRGQYKVDKTGESIIVGNEGQRHILGQRQSPEAIKTLPHLPEIIQKAFKTGEYNPKPRSGPEPDSRIKAIYHSAVTIDGRPYDVQLVASRRKDGTYVLDLYDVRARDKAARPAGTQDVPGTSVDADPALTLSNLAGKAESDGIHSFQGETTEFLAENLSDIKIADFFGEVKDIVDEVPAVRPAAGEGKAGGVAARGDDFGGSGGAGMGEGNGGTALAAPESAGLGAEKAFFINFARIDTPEDVKEAMQFMANRYRDELNAARRGEKMSFKQMELNADQEDAWQILSERRTGEPLNAEQSLAARNLWASSGQKLTEAAKLVAAAPTAENQFAFMKMVNVHNSIQKEVIAARTETARALASWRITSGPKELQLRQMEDALESVRGRGLFSNKNAGGQNKVIQLAKTVAQFSDAGMVRQMDTLIEKSPFAIAFDMIAEYRVMAMLSNVKTHAVNTLSNTFVAMQQVFERGVAARIGRALGDDTGVQVGEGLAMMHGQISAIKDGLRLAAKAFKDNSGGLWAGKVDLPHKPAISSENLGLARDSTFGKAVDVIGTVVRIPGRALMASDEFFKTVGYRSELNAQAFRQATREAAAGKIGKDQIRERMADILENPPDNLKIAAVDHATYSTFSDAPGRLAQGWLNLCRDNPYLRFITPFIRTPSRIFNYAVAERSPLAPLFWIFNGDIAAGGARRQLALAKASTSSAIMLAAADLAFNGHITGGGPSNPAERQTLTRTGWQPYSIKIGDRYYSYARTDPLGMTLGIAAEMVEITNNMSHDDEEVDLLKTGILFAASIAGNIMSKSYLSGLSSVMDALSDPERYVEGVVERFAGSFVPAGLAEVARANDPYMLEVSNIVEAMKARVPGLSKDLEARRDLWGRVISYRSGLGVLYDALSPIASRRESPEPIDEEMLRQEVYIKAPTRKVDFGTVTVDLSRFRGAYTRYAKLAGNEAKDLSSQKGCMDLLNETVQGRGYRAAEYDMLSDGPKGGKAEFIKAHVSKHQDLAKKQLLNEYPDLRAYVEEKKAQLPGKYAF